MKRSFLALVLMLASAAGALRHQGFDVDGAARANCDSTAAPFSRLANEAFALANEVFEKAGDVAYEHTPRPAAEQVLNTGGEWVARTDCSGFVSYILNKAAPAPQYAAVMDYARRQYREDQERQNRTPRKDRPYYPDAKEYADFFGTLSTQTAVNGWIGVATVWDLRRGDIIAWAKENWDGKGNSGHVAIVVEPPAREFVETTALEKNKDGIVHEVKIRCIRIRVLDSSSVSHFDDEKLPPSVKPRQQQRDGVGIGYIRLVLDSVGTPIRYWEGYYWGEGQKEIKAPSKSSDIHFGRLID